MSKPQRTNDQLFAQFLADVYVLAWQQYQKYEKNMSKAWLFQSGKFLSHIKCECVGRALKERYEHRYKDCLFFAPVKAAENSGFQLVNVESTYVYVSSRKSGNDRSPWRLSILKSEILEGETISAVADALPDLAAAFDFELAAKATNAELIQQAIPKRDDPRTTTMHMPAWDEDDQTWNVREVKRRVAT